MEFVPIPPPLSFGSVHAALRDPQFWAAAGLPLLPLVPSVWPDTWGIWATGAGGDIQARVQLPAPLTLAELVAAGPALCALLARFGVRRVRVAPPPAEAPAAAGAILTLVFGSDPQRADSGAAVTALSARTAHSAAAPIH